MDALDIIVSASLGALTAIALLAVLYALGVLDR